MRTQDERWSDDDSTDDSTEDQQDFDLDHCGFADEQEEDEETAQGIVIVKTIDGKYRKYYEPELIRIDGVWCTSDRLPTLIIDEDYPVELIGKADAGELAEARNGGWCLGDDEVEVVYVSYEGV